ncbi:MAG: GNAT family N-acetyltransferase [Henriciella sp.]|nr:GNAT family N-acetyltransferase [Henriciella sp.]
MIQIRPANIGDAEFIADVYRPFVAGGWTSFETEPPTSAVIAERIKSAGDLYPWLIAERDNTPAAYAYASAHRSRAAYQTSVDTAIYCAPSARGKGVAKHLYGALLDLLTRQNFVMAFAGIALPNDASVGLHRSAGFELIGTYPNVGFKAGAWRSTQWWARPLAVPQTPPARIRPLQEIS